MGDYVCRIDHLIPDLDTGKPSIQLFNDRNFMSGIFVRFYVLLYIDL